MSSHDASGVAPVEYPSLDVVEFYRDVWRRRPVVWRRCASEFLAPSLDWPEVDALDAELTGSKGGDSDARRSPDGTVLFVNQAQYALPRLAGACVSLATRFGWEACTADISVTRGPGAGIGCHFDHSDNFVVQQHGTKRWRVGLPAHTTAARQRARMLETKGFIPRGRLPQDPFEVDLHAGDVLYLPLFAPHQGVESTDGTGSISVSFSYNAKNALGRYIEPLLRRLADDEAWWGPLPVTGPNQGGLADALRDALSAVLSPREDDAVGDAAERRPHRSSWAPVDPLGDV